MTAKPKSATSSAPAAARKRRWKSRRAEGVVVVTLEIRENFTDALVALGWLDVMDVHRREPVQAATQRFLDAVPGTVRGTRSG